MKRLVLLGEGHGETSALPVLVNRLLSEKAAGSSIYVDRQVIRDSPTRMVKWNKEKREADCSEWIKRVSLASRRREIGGVLAVYDGDAKKFPAGSGTDFCAASVAKLMARSAVSAGAGKTFSLAVVFACAEYESWLVAGAESYSGKALPDGRLILPADVQLPTSDHELRGKGWFERNCTGYRPTRDQEILTQMVDFKIVRAKKLRSFERLEKSLDQLMKAVSSGNHVSTPV